MKTLSKTLVGSLACAALILPQPAAVAASSKEARVTQIIREVKLLPENAAAREAALNEKVSEDTGVRTGGESRSELTFPDLTITRLGANTIFSFTKSGRTANLDTGSILLRVPKDSGGGTIRSSAVTVAVTGTTVIFEGTRGGRSKLYNLEGSSRVTLKSKPGDPRKVLAGQMLDVPAGATTLPMPENFDVNQLMRTHPLITDFKPLPSAPLILAVAQQPPAPVYTGPNFYPVINPPHGPRHYPPGTTPPGPVRNPPSTQPPGPTKPPINTRPPRNDTPPSSVDTKPPTTPTPGPILRTGPNQTTTTKPTATAPPKRYIPKKQSTPPPGPR